MKNRAGEYKLNLSGNLQCRTFVPKPLPPEPPLHLDEEGIQLLSLAHRSLGILQGISSQVPDIDMFISMYVRKEALLSSQIEGTQATLDDILDPDIDENINRHVAEVLTYIQAFYHAKKRLSELPLSNRLLRETHAVLMQGQRGSNKAPGEFRRSQNWIGPEGGKLEDARYIPPNPVDMVLAMSDLEKFIHREDFMDPLIKIGLVHYQFETIHPFLDGNGRLGRLLILLFLMEKGILSHETLYVSLFLKKHRLEYYDRLLEVRKKGNYEQWVNFFLLAVHEASEDAIRTIQALTSLHKKNFRSIESTGRAAVTIKKVLAYLERNPIVDIKKTSMELGVSFKTVSNAFKTLVSLGMLEQARGQKRNRIFAYEEYLAILRKDTDMFS